MMLYYLSISFWNITIFLLWAPSEFAKTGPRCGALIVKLVKSYRVNCVEEGSEVVSDTNLKKVKGAEA